MENAQLGAKHTNAPQIAEDAASLERTTGPAKAATAGLTKGAELDAAETPARQAAVATGAGLIAGADAKAKLPYEKELAQTRANVQLLNQKEIDDYKKSHPGIPAEQLNKHANATSAITLIDSEIKPLYDEMAKRNMLGTLAGRAEEIATNKLKTEKLFPNPEDAQLAARFFDSSKLLSSLVAKTHGGARAISSQGTQNYFNQIFNGIGDPAILKGQLGSVYKLMQIYQDKPDTPEGFPIPGFDPTAVQGSGLELSPRLKQRLGGQ